MMSGRLEAHQQDYKEGIFKTYSLAELGQWVHLFHKRSWHRENPSKARKDLYDAKNYLHMMELTLRDRASELGIDFDKL